MTAGVALVRPPSTRMAEGLVTYAERVPADPARAARQHAAYVAALADAGWGVHPVAPADDLPDSAFVEDTVVVLGDLAVLTRPGAAERRAEVAGTEAAIRALGLEIARIEAPGTLDGGDVLQVGATVYAGRGGRTNAEGIRQLGEHAATRGRTVVPVALHRVLHLKSAVTALPDGTIVGADPSLLDTAPFPDVRVVPEEAGAHVVPLGGATVLIAASAPRTAALLAGEGLDVVTVDIGEFEKLEGCVTCLSVLVGHARRIGAAPAGGPPVRSRECSEPTVEADRRTLEALQRITDAALAHLSEGDLLDGAAAAHHRHPRHRHGRHPPARAGPRRAAGAGREGDRGGGRAGRGDPGRQGVRRARGGRAAGDRHRGRRPRRHLQPDPAREGHPLAARRAAGGQGAPDRRAARRQPHPPRVHRRRAPISSRSPPTARRSPSRTPSCSSASGRRATRRRPRGAGSRPSSASPTRPSPTCPRSELLIALLDRISAVMGTDTAAILLLVPERDVLRARAAKGIEEEVEQGVEIPVGEGFAGRVVAERRAIAIEDVDHADILNPILREKGIRSLLGVPLLVEGRPIGVLHVGSLTPRRFSAEERDLLQLGADRAALAIDHAILFEQRRLAETLQRRLLPQNLERVGGLEVASRYLPAVGETLGGDWYDAFALDRDRVALAVGDVVGHGIEAAAVMAQLRTALRAYAAEGHPGAGGGRAGEPPHVGRSGRGR